MFHLAVLNALRMPMLINAQNPLRLPVSLLALVTMSTTAWMASTVDPPFRKSNWFSERPFSRTMWPCSLCRIISFRSFPIVSNRHIGLYDEASPRGLLSFFSRTNLCFFQSTKNLPFRRQELKASRRVSGYAPITSLRISFGTPSIPGAVFALSLPSALFSSSRVKSSSRRATQELWSYLWKGSRCGDKLRTMYLTRSGLSRHGGFFYSPISCWLLWRTPWVLLDVTDQVFPVLKSAFLYALPQSWFFYFPCLMQQRITLWAGGSPPRCEVR